MKKNSLGNYDIGPKATVFECITKLELARENHENIYVIARLAAIARSMVNEKIGLTPREKHRLIKALRDARYGRKPLAEWLPRGYQVARLLMTAREAIPERTFRMTKRDKKLIRLADLFYRQSKDPHAKVQLGSLRRTIRFLEKRPRAQR